MSDLLTTEEVARLLRFHPKHVYRLFAEGLPRRRAGRRWLFDRDQVLAWAAARGAGVPAADAVRGDGETVRPSARPPVVAANGDVAVEILLQRLLARGIAAGFAQTDAGHAAKLLAEGRVVAAGLHGDFPIAGEARHMRLHLVRRAVGLVVRPRCRFGSLASVSRMRLASRPPTAGVRRHLDAALLREGLDPDRIHARALLFGSHRDVVCAVASGRADVGIASHAWADRLGLPFFPIVEEDYALVLRAADAADPIASALCEEAQTASFRTAVASVAGYDASDAGRLLFDPLEPETLPEGEVTQ